jgi:hypothetical protein
MDQEGSLITADSAPRSLPVDVEHVGIRLAVPAAAFVGLVVLYVALSALFSTGESDEAFGCVIFGLAGGGALGVGAVADRVLKRIWPSKRRVVIDAEGIRLTDRRKGADQQISIRWAHRINALGWRFTVKRGSARIPKGWIMLGCQLIQDDVAMILYTFAPAKEADESRYAGFIQLVLRSVINKGELPLREANRQRRLLRLEDERWEDGAELRHADFAFLIDTLARYGATWQEQS